MLKKLILSIIVISLFTNIYSQKITNKAFKEGEKLTLLGSYYMSQLWTNLVQITLETSSVKADKTEVYRLSGTAYTFTQWDNFFKIRDSYQSWVEKETLLPLLYKRDVSEGNYTKEEKYVFKHKTQIINTVVKRKAAPVKQNTVKIGANTCDLVTLVYWIRNLDYEKMKLNQVETISVVMDERLENVLIKFKGTEEINVGKYGRKKCYKIGISVQNQQIIKTKESNNIWLTADKNHVPVLIKAEIPVGRIQLQLTEMTGLKN